MREFSDFEKNVISIMVMLYKDNNLCLSLLYRKLYRDNVYVEFYQKGQQIVAKIFYNHNFIDIKTLNDEIKYINFLVDELAKKFLSTETPEIVSVDNQYIKGGYGFIELYSVKNLASDYKHLFLCKIILSHSLVDLVDNNFKTPEQRQFEKQLDDANAKHIDAMDKAQTQVKYSRLAFGASLITLLISLVFGIIEMCTDTKINNDQFNQIKQTIKQATPPDVIKTKITNDTLTTRIVEKPKAQ